MSLEAIVGYPKTVLDSLRKFGFFCPEAFPTEGSLAGPSPLQAMAWLSRGNSRRLPSQGANRNGCGSILRVAWKKDSDLPQNLRFLGVFFDPPKMMTGS